MSLHGTLETFALPDVLALLAATKKSGELRVAGGRTDGRVWFDAGQVVEADVGSATTFVDAVFELLRLTTGKFTFDAEKLASEPTSPAAIEGLLGEAQARLTEWRAIEAVVPSLQHAVRLAAEVREPHIMVNGDQWRTLVAVASGSSVQSVVDRMALGEFGTCKLLRELVDAGLAAVDGPPAAAAAPAPPIAEPETVVVEAPPVAPAPEPAPEPVVKAPPVASAPEPAPAVVEAPPVASAPEPAPEPVVAEAPAPVAPEEHAHAPIVALVTAAVDVATSKVAPLVASPALSALEIEDELVEAPVKARKAKAPQAVPASAADLLVDQVAALTKAAEQATEPAPDVLPPPAPTPEPELVGAAPGTDAAAVAEAKDEPAAEGEEPINRGLLLKFLSSVRN